MKNKVVSLFMYAATLCLLSFARSDDYAGFGISSAAVNERLWHVFTGSVSAPYFSNAVKEVCRAIPAGSQAAAVRKAGDLFKAYFRSADFTKKHQSWLESAFRQQSGRLDDDRRAAILEQKIAETQNVRAEDMAMIADIHIQAAGSVAALESMLASLPGDQQAEMKKQIDLARANAAFFKKVKPLLQADFPEFKKQYASYLAQDEIRQAEEHLARSNARNASDHENWKDPEKILRERLTEFLDQTENIDFTARTKEINGKTKFVDGACEAKNNVWKFCFRIGPEPALAARAYARQWLSELN